MTRVNTSNFGNSTLASGIGASGVTTFTLQTGGGNTFSTVNTGTPYVPDYFLVAIDQELILCSGRTGDVFTIAQRGMEGTTAISHVAGAPVVETVTAGMMTQIWQNLPQVYNPNVPPWYRGATTGAQLWDDEFEQNLGNVGSANVGVPTQGNTWTFTPQDGGQTHSFGQNYPSCFDFHRNSGTVYWLYQPFSLSGPFTVTARISHSAPLDQSLTGLQYALSMFVSDSANPSTSNEGGNRARVDSIYHAQGITLNGQATSVRYIRGAKDVSGSFSAMHVSGSGDTAIMLHQGQTHYSLSYDGTSTWAAYAGDGLTYGGIGYQSGFTFTPRSLGFRFWLGGSGDVPGGETVLIDWVRVNPVYRGTYTNFLPN